MSIRDCYCYTVRGLLISLLQTESKLLHVCSSCNEKAVYAIVSFLLGPERAEKMQIFAGDVVPKKKPDPAIYTLASTTLGVDPVSCAVVEDSAIGLTAAKAAGMKCIVTRSGYTANEDFERRCSFRLHRRPSRGKVQPGFLWGRFDKEEALERYTHCLCSLKEFGGCCCAHKM